MQFVEKIQSSYACLCCSKMNATNNNLVFFRSDELRVRVRLSQDYSVSEKLEEGVVVAEEDQSQRYRLVPLFGAYQRVQLVEYNGTFQDDEYV